MSILSSHRIKGLVDLEPTFQQIIEQYGLPDNWSRPEGFPTLSKIILEQQVSLSSAKATYQKLEERLGDITPQNILTLDQEAMRSCYVSRQKAKYLHELSKAVINKTLDLHNLKKNADTEIEKSLIAIKGIGPWTAQCYMIFALQRPDIYPRGDVALNNAVRKLWPVQSLPEIYSLSEKWAPYRTTASFLLWHFYLCERGRKWEE